MAAMQYLIANRGLALDENNFICLSARLNWEKSFYCRLARWNIKYWYKVEGDDFADGAQQKNR